MKTGIYILRFKGTDKVYIGQSVNIFRRYSAHLRALRNNVSSSKLREAYQMYGEPSLEILLECDAKSLDMEEIQAIEIFDSCTNGFNTFDTILGSNNQVGEDASNSIYNNKVYEEVFLLCVEGILPNQEIASILEVSYSVVSSISACQNHRWLKDIYPVEYSLLEERKNKPNGYKNTAKYLGIEYPNVVSPKGEILTIGNLREFAREHNLDSGNLCFLLKGSLSTLKGYKLVDTELRQYPVLIKDNKEYQIPYRGARAFALQHGLSAGNLSALLNGKKTHYKGWTVKHASS